MTKKKGKLPSKTINRISKQYYFVDMADVDKACSFMYGMAFD